MRTVISAAALVVALLLTLDAAFAQNLTPLTPAGHCYKNAGCKMSSNFRWNICTPSQEEAAWRCLADYRGKHPGKNPYSSKGNIRMRTATGGVKIIRRAKSWDECVRKGTTELGYSQADATAHCNVAFRR